MKNILTSCILLIPFLLASQKLDMDLFEKIEPRSIGPGGMAGRITSIDVVHSQSEIIYVGTASGGLRKSTSGKLFLISKRPPLSERLQFNNQIHRSFG